MDFRSNVPLFLTWKSHLFLGDLTRLHIYNKFLLDWKTYVLLIFRTVWQKSQIWRVLQMIKLVDKLKNTKSLFWFSEQNGGGERGGMGIAGTIFCHLENGKYLLWVLFYIDPTKFFRINQPISWWFEMYISPHLFLLFCFPNYHQNASNCSIYRYYKPGLLTKFWKHGRRKDSFCSMSKLTQKD